MAILQIIILKKERLMHSYILAFTDGSFHKNTGVGACYFPFYGNQYFYLTSNLDSPYEA